MAERVRQAVILSERDDPLFLRGVSRAVHDAGMVDTVVHSPRMASTHLTPSEVGALLISPDLASDEVSDIKSQAAELGIPTGILKAVRRTNPVRLAFVVQEDQPRRKRQERPQPEELHSWLARKAMQRPRRRFRRSYRSSRFA